MKIEIDTTEDSYTLQLERQKTIDSLSSILDTLEAEREFLYSIFIRYRNSHGKIARETIAREGEMQGILTAIRIVKDKISCSTRK